MSRKIKNLLINLIGKIPINNKIILFESMPDYSDNSMTVYNEMISRHINDYFIIIWLKYEKESKLKKSKNVFSINAKNRILYHYFVSRARCIVCCNRIPKKLKKEQLNIYLCHGIPMKGTTKLNLHLPENLSYFNVDSDYVKNIQSREYHFSSSKFVVLGSPRNDLFYKNDTDNLIIKKGFRKLIVWYPTFRQHKRAKTRIDGNTAIPLINCEQEYNELNEYAANNNILIVIKPHFNQDLNYINMINKSNVMFIDDSFFIKHKITSYQLLKNSDALLSDYSSVYYDYLLLNKPIGLIWSDIDEYKNMTGFAVDIDEICSGAYKIYNMNDMYSFLDSVINCDDKYAKERNEIKNKVFKYDDGQNSRRVVDFILKELTNE